MKPGSGEDGIRRRRGLVAVVAVGLVVGGVAFAATWWFLASPYWSLYQIGKGIYERDPRRVLPYLDVARILEGLLQHQTLKDTSMRSDTKLLAMALGGAMIRAMEPGFKDMLAQAIADPKRRNIESPWVLVLAADVQITGNAASVEIKDPKGQRLRAEMEKRAGRWVVVEVNPEDLEKILKH